MTMLRNLWLPLSAAFRLDRRAALIAFLEVVGTILSNLLPLAFGLMVTGVATRSEATLVTGSVLAAIAFGVVPVFTTVGVEARLRLNESVGHEFDRRVAELMAAVPTLDQLESPAFRDQAQIVRERQGALGGAYNSMVNAIRNLMMPVVTLIVAIGADARLLWLLPGVAAQPPARPLAGAGGTAGRRTKARSPAASPSTSSASPSNPTRPRSSGSWGRGAWSPRSSAPRERPGGDLTCVPTSYKNLAATGCGLLYLIAAGIVLTVIARDAADGHVPVGAVATSVLVIGQLQNVVSSLRFGFQMLAQVVRTVGRYRQLEDAVASAQAAEGTGTPPDQLHTGLSLRGLGFTYPGQDSPSLTEVDLDLPAGSIVAIVGENGAGKSTLVKLLTGLYHPTEGQVLVDGVDLATLSGTAWRARCAGAFQDHVHLELMARESITTGDLPALDNDERALQALDDAAASDVLVALPGGLTTQLGTSWDDGTELSGGQWQRLAIARGMMRGDPLLLVLDEPTSALDAATEHALFEGYADAARRAGRRGAVTVLVTHRFSTVAAADLVVVLADGRVSEVGGHAELMAAGGSYAQLYSLQARGYA